MTEFDVKIITCAKTFGRLNETLPRLQSLLSQKGLKNASIVINKDIGQYDESTFEPQKWKEHIKRIYPILMLNILNASGGNIKPGRLTEMEPNDLFHPRELSQSEKSLCWKHFLCLSECNRTTLTMEDDGLLIKDKVDDLNNIIKIANGNDTYTDLGEFPGLTKRGKLIRTYGLDYYVMDIACTRTTCAAIYNKKVANILAENYWPCALPADLHLQYLLQSHKIPGIWPLRKIFDHSSGLGIVNSSIDKGNEI